MAKSEPREERTGYRRVVLEPCSFQSTHKTGEGLCYGTAPSALLSRLPRKC